MASLSAGLPAGRRNPPSRPDGRRTRVGWEGAVLRVLEFVAYPALAGCAVLLLCAGVVTWLPALAAAGNALQRWRDDAAAQPFLGTLRAFPGYWRRLWPHAVVSTGAGLLLVTNVVFLAGRSGPPAMALLALQVGLLLAFVPYHLALAVTAARDADGVARDWSRRALLLAFASPRRGLALLAAPVAVVVLTAPLALGPVLLGPTVPLLIGLRLADRTAGPTER